MKDVFVVFQVFSVVVAFVLMLVLTKQKESKARTYLQWFSVAIFLDVMAYYYEINSETLKEALLAIKFEYLTTCFATYLALMFVAEYLHITVNKFVRRGYMINNTIVYFFVATDNIFHALYREAYLEIEDGFAIIHTKPGPIYIWYAITTLSTIVILVIMLVNSYLKRRNKLKEHLAFVIAGLVPLIAWTFKFVKGLQNFDFVSVGLLFTDICFLYVIIKLRVFDFIKEAKDSIMDSISEAVFVVDNNGNVSFRNKKSDNLIGDKPCLTENDIFAELSLYDEDWFARNDRIYSMGSDYVYNNSEIKGKIYWFEDITDMVEKNRQLVALKDEAVSANNAKSEFLSHMSHEIRTPINTILGLNEVIFRDSQSDEIRGYSHNIKNAGQTLMTLINDILDFTKIESGKMQIINVEYNFCELLEYVVDMIRIRIGEKGLTLNVNISDDLPSTLMGDDVKIRQIITNILSNAAKYTQKGYISVTVTGNYVDNDDIELNVIIKDTGIGIKPEDMDRLFESFERLDEKINRNIEGTGLGMAITQKLLLMMGSTLNVESVYGEGSTFSFSLRQKVCNYSPIGDFRELLENKCNDEKYCQKFVAPDAKILVVDDNNMNCVVIKALLKKTQVNIDAVNSGMKCIDMMKNEDYDLILMDHMMPIMDGVETFECLREQNLLKDNSIPVIALTANAILGAKEFYLSKGFTDFLTKPISGDVLEEILIKYLRPELLYDETGEKITDCNSTDFTNAEKFLENNGVNVRKAIKYSDNKIDNYRELVRIMIKESKILINDIIETAENGNLKDYAINVHSVKSCARTLGDERLSELALKHEIESKNSNLDYVKKNVDNLINECKKSYAVLEEYIGLVNNEHIEQDKKAMTKERWISLVADITVRLEDYDAYNAEKILDTAFNYEMNDDQRLICEKTRQFIDEFNYSEALNIITKGEWLNE